MNLEELNLVKRLGKMKVKREELKKQIKEVEQLHADINQQLLHLEDSYNYYQSRISDNYYSKVDFIYSYSGSPHNKDRLYRVSKKGFKSLTPTEKKQYKNLFKVYNNEYMKYESLKREIEKFRDELEDLHLSLQEVENRIRSYNAQLDYIRNPGKLSTSPKRNKFDFDDDIPF